jgi:hypothetical protein
MIQSVEIDVAPLLQPKEEAKEEEQKTLSCRDTAGDYLGNPKIILGISSLFFTGYISFIYLAGGFSQQFLHFGPGTNDENTAQFLGITLDTWPKVGLMYLAGFLSSLMSNYYYYAMNTNLHSYIWNRAIKKVPFSKRWTYVVILAEPIFMQLLTVISFFTTLTLQLQFILPQFIGGMIMEVPFSLQRLREKEFASV